MQLKKLRDPIIKYLDSFFFPLTVALFALIIWLTPGNYVYIPVSLYAVLCLLPLASENGKPYIPLFLFEIIVSDDRLLLTSLSGELVISVAAIFLSVTLHLIIYKRSFQLGDMFYSILILLAVFFVSYIKNMIVGGESGIEGIIHILLLLLLLISGCFLSTLLGKGESIPYLCTSVMLLAITIVTETYTSLLMDKLNPFDFPSLMLGWSYDNNIANTILCLSLPFFAMAIARKRIFWIFGMLYVFSGIIVLSTASGFLCVLLGLIPLIFLSFKDYGRKYPYLVLISLVVAGGTIALLMGLSQTANENIINAIRSINLALDIPEGRKAAFESATTNIAKYPALGISAASLIDESGAIVFSQNTVLSTMLLGGSIGLIAYVFMEIRLYYIVLVKKCPEKYLFLLMFLFLEILGLGSDTIYEIPVFLFYIVCVSVYIMSDRPQDVIIHEGNFDYYANNTNMDLR